MTEIKEPSIERRGFLKLSGGALALSTLTGKLLGKSNAALAPTVRPKEANTTVKHGFCHFCHYAKCNVLYSVEDDLLVGVEGDPDGPWNEGSLCVRGLGTVMSVYNPYRVKAPLKRTNPEKGLDVDPGWVEISWDEALDTIASKLKEIRADDPRKLLEFAGFPSYGSFVGGIAGVFTAVFGTPNLFQHATGSMCSVHLGISQLAGGFIMTPDYEYGKYVLSIGFANGPNQGSSDGGTRAVIDAVKRGMRIVSIDPRRSPEASYGEWVPIRPGTDFPFLLAMAHVILHEIDKVDEWFLKNRTTGPYLITPDGSDYVRDPETNKPMVWDNSKGRARRFDVVEPMDMALEGTYEVNGISARTAFDLLKEGMEEYTPEWAEEITTISADTIRRISNEFVEAARIGSTITINGFEFPHRPAAISIGRGLTGHRDGHLAYWMAMVINQLVGAVMVPGGLLCAPDPTALAPDADGVVLEEDWHSAYRPPVFPPTRACADEFIPYGMGDYRWVDVILEPENYHLPYQPEAAITYGSNYFTKGEGDVDRISEAFRRIPFLASIAYHIDEESLFADIVLPDCSFVEQALAYQFVVDRPGSGCKVVSALGHKPIVQPLHQSRQPDEIFMDLAERIGMLYGPGQLNFVLNKRLRLKPEYEIALDKRYTVEDLNDRALRSTYGDEATFDALAEKGAFVIELPPQARYNYFYFPGNKTRHPLYNMGIVRAGNNLLNALQKAGYTHPGWSEEEIRFYYVGVPTWKPTPIIEAPPEYDLYGVVWKTPHNLFDISNTNANPYIQEVLETDSQFGKVNINSETAKKKGLKDGDLVFMESQFGGKIGPYPIKITELIHPDAVGVASGMARQYEGVNPLAERGIAYNRLLTTNWEATDIWTNGIELSPRIKLTKA